MEKSKELEGDLDSCISEQADDYNISPLLFACPT